MNVHPTAIIDPLAKIHPSCKSGPYCVIGPQVQLGEGCHLVSHVTMEGPSKIGADNGFFPFSSIGLAPQDITYAGEPTQLEIGDHNQIREFVKEPIAYRFEYADGLKATMLLMNGLVNDLTFAARIKGEAMPLSTLFYLPPTPNVTYSAGLMSQAERMFLTGKAPYPIERTLLTTGLVAAGMQSLAEGQKRIETPHLSIRYHTPRESTFLRS